VFFTDHSLPERVLEMKDPYPDEMIGTMEAVRGCWAAGLLGVTTEDRADQREMPGADDRIETVRG